MTRLCGLLATFEFAYFVAPRSAQSLFMSIHYISKGVSSFAILGYTSILSKYSFDLKFTVSIQLEKSSFLIYYFNHFS